MRASVRAILVTALLMASRVLAPAQPAASASTFQSHRPLADASVQFQQSRGETITCEDPILIWEGDLEEMPGKSSHSGYLYPKSQAFWIPPGAAAERDLGAALDQIVEAYHRQTSGTRFTVLRSKLGFHVVPLQAHDATGVLAPVDSLLDARVIVAMEKGTAREHLKSFAAAVEAVSGMKLDLTHGAGSPRAFDQFWGVPEEFAGELSLPLPATP